MCPALDNDVLILLVRQTPTTTSTSRTGSGTREESTRSGLCDASGQSCMQSTATFALTLEFCGCRVILACQPLLFGLILASRDEWSYAIGECCSDANRSRMSTDFFSFPQLCSWSRESRSFVLLFPPCLSVCFDRSSTSSCLSSSSRSSVAGEDTDLPRGPCQRRRVKPSKPYNPPSSPLQRLIRRRTTTGEQALSPLVSDTLDNEAMPRSSTCWRG